MERVNLDQLVFGGNIVDFYKLNTQFMYEKYSKSEEDCEAIAREDIREGGFYFLQYMDDSNWMRWSPIFCCEESYRVARWRAESQSPRPGRLASRSAGTACGSHGRPEGA